MSKLFALAFLGLAALASASAQATNSDLPDGPGKAVVLRMCTACHSTDVITSKRASPDEWAGVVQLMVSRGADGSDADIDVVTKYLSASFPPVKATPPATPAPTSPAPAVPAAPKPTSHLDINTAGAHALAVSLSLTGREADALVRYRALHGSFTRWQQVAAVPGISATKIERSRQIIRF